MDTDDGDRVRRSERRVGSVGPGDGADDVAEPELGEQQSPDAQYQSAEPDRSLH
jgi:hypothetical protein